MTELNILRDKDPREVALLLAGVSSSMLPNPGVGQVLHRTATDPEFIKAVLSEIRHRLTIREDDYSRKTQARIYAFLSDALSNAALANTDVKNIKARLGNKGELRPSDYEIRINDDVVPMLEALGTKRSHVIEAILRPDKVTHLLNNANLEVQFRPTISIKSIDNRNPEDRFILLIHSVRDGNTQHIGSAFRVYPSDVDLTTASEPVDVLKAFVNKYGLTFQLGVRVSKCMVDEVLEVKRSTLALIDRKDRSAFTLLDGEKGDYFLPLVDYLESQLQGSEGESLVNITLAFMVDISAYVSTLRKHGVQSIKENKWRFPRV